MRKTGSRIVTPLFSLLFAASLTFGVASVFSQADAKECMYDPPTFLGACFSNEECTERCIAQGGYAGECSQMPDGKKCCFCAY
jgi:hypothetical protein